MGSIYISVNGLLQVLFFSNFLLNKHSLTPAMCKQEEEVREKRAIHVGSHLEMISFL